MIHERLRSVPATWIVSLLLGARVFAAPAIQPAETRQHAHTFETRIPVRLDYLCYLPAGYDPQTDKKWPVIVFLHGSGERGTDIEKVKQQGPPKVVEGKKDFPFVVISPQCPAGRLWRPYELDALLDEILTTYHVDADHVYLTGLSMGGFGTWDWAAQSASRFAAIAPMCGGGDPQFARRLRDLPVWVFHGDKDPAVPVQRSDQMVEALKKAGADVHYTRYEGVGHDCWTRSYENPDLYAWFLSHQRAEKHSPETRPADGPSEAPAPSDHPATHA